jgi:hypothetical protein
VDVFDNIVVALFLLLVFFINFGFVIDEDVTLRLSPAFGGPSLEKSVLRGHVPVF